MILNPELVFLLIYFLGRATFLDLNTYTLQARRFLKYPRGRVYIGLLVFLISKNIYASLLLIFLYEMLVHSEYLSLRYLKTNRNQLYIWHMLAALVVIPILLNWLDPLLPYKRNYLQLYTGLIFTRASLLKPLISNSMANKTGLILTGFLFVLKDATILIRAVLTKIKAVPMSEEKPAHKDEKEYEKGRLIGNLERSLMYFLIILDQIGAIAIIVALKSLARFKELDNKNFAEYFLIGSLLSLLLAAIPAIIVQYLL